MGITKLPNSILDRIQSQGTALYGVFHIAPDTDAESGLHPTQSASIQLILFLSGAIFPVEQFSIFRYLVFLPLG